MLVTNKFKVRPNPSAKQVLIELADENGMAEIEIMNAMGKVVYQGVHKSTGELLPVSLNASAGMYLVQVRINEEVHFSKVVIS